MINWQGIVNNALSVLVAAVFVGAAAIVWDKVTTIDETVNKHTESLRLNQGSLIDTQAELQASQQAIIGTIAELETRLATLNSQLSSLQYLLGELNEISSSYSTIQSEEPLILPQFQLPQEEPDSMKMQRQETIQREIISLKPTYEQAALEKLQMQRQAAN